MNDNKLFYIFAYGIYIVTIMPLAKQYYDSRSRSVFSISKVNAKQKDAGPCDTQSK